MLYFLVYEKNSAVSRVSLVDVIHDFGEITVNSGLKSIPKPGTYKLSELPWKKTEARVVCLADGRRLQLSASALLIPWSVDLIDLLSDPTLFIIEEGELVPNPDWEESTILIPDDTHQLGVDKVDGVGKAYADKLSSAGYSTVGALSEASPAMISEILGISESKAADLVAAAIAKLSSAEPKSK